MTDLVARLRSRREFASLGGSRWYTTTGPDRDCAEAAEEIERLRALHDKLSGAALVLDLCGRIGHRFPKG